MKTHPYEKKADDGHGVLDSAVLNHGMRLAQSGFVTRRIRGRTREFYLIVSNISNRKKLTIERGEKIVRYGGVIGRAARGMSSGTHVHIQNVEDLMGRGDLKS